MKKRYMTIFIVLLFFAFAFSAAAGVMYCRLHRNDTIKPEKITTVPATEATADQIAVTEATSDSAAVSYGQPSERSSEKPAESTDVPSTEHKEPASAPESLTELLKKDDLSVQSLSDRGCSQLITVQSSGSDAEICFYSLDNGRWTKADSMTCSGSVGANGVTADIHEGLKATPKGLYAVGDAFYRDKAPATELNTFRIRKDTYWVDDPKSAYYNQKVEGTENKDWDSAEEMYAIENYDYGFVIEYNTGKDGNAIKPGAGSAFFFHSGSGGPTLGCVRTATSNVLMYLKKLAASLNPYILIV